MRFKSNKTIAAATVATIVISISVLTLTGCQGRKMSNMEPTGETVEVEINTSADSISSALTDSSIYE